VHAKESLYIIYMFYGGLTTGTQEGSNDPKLPVKMLVRSTSSFKVQHNTWLKTVAKANMESLTCAKMSPPPLHDVLHPLDKK
jgi:hypothetical protein